VLKVPNVKNERTYFHDTQKTQNEFQNSKNPIWIFFISKIQSTFKRIIKINNQLVIDTKRTTAPSDH